MTRILTVAFACAAIAFIGPRAHAQGMISGAKAVAGRAAAATNAHTAAEQNPAATTTPAPAAKTTAAPAAKTTAAPAAKTTPAATAKSTPMAPVTTTAKSAPVVATTTKPIAPVPAATTKPVATTATAKPVTAAPAAANGKSAATTSAKPIATTAKAAPVAVSDTAARSISVTQRGIKGEVSLNREVFNYDAGGRRDPFVSLLRNGDLRPMLNDLRLMVVLYDPTGRNSVAIMRDVSTKDQYRVRVGVTLGRMRVAQIEPHQVIFTIEEIGFSRQEALALGDSSRVRTQ
jgi:hypothetical protein